jgi:hypothetical protein
LRIDGEHAWDCQYIHNIRITIVYPSLTIVGLEGLTEDDTEEFVRYSTVVKTHLTLSVAHFHLQWFK